MSCPVYASQKGAGAMVRTAWLQDRRMQKRWRAGSCDELMPLPASVGAGIALLSDAEVPEAHIQNVFHIHAAQELAQRPRRQAQLLRHDFLSPLGGCGLRIAERKRRLLQMRALALARHQSGLRGKIVLTEPREGGDQLV